ncbi:hypothetical protein [Leuconostoc lactis]|uniref:hypothetical protein n=1 Tax=Leuconostoc lactis TaxID=1246 RepID=UPI00259684DF|nr:hypothetical protein [Leuconostoc lactis]
MLKYMLLFVGIVFWLYCLTVLKRAKNGAFYFLVGSTGLFIGLLLMSKPYGIWLFATAMTWAVGACWPDYWIFYDILFSPCDSSC